jgi:hypothetical protein
MTIKLVSVKKSIKPTKKYTATFNVDGKEKMVHFGAEGYTDYTLGASDETRQAYRARHRNDRINEPMTPGALSYYLLWGVSRDLSKNISLFKKQFKV